MKIAIIGTGYVGLVTGTCFAETGNEVTCVDSNREKVNALKKGHIPIYEPGLEPLVERNLREGRLKFTGSVEKAVKGSLFSFIAVGTPPKKDGSSDLSSVWDVARKIGRAVNGYKIVVTKSTVPVGTTEKVKNIIAGETTEPFDVASNPEFLKEGAAIEDFMKPDRVVVGAEDPRVAEFMKELYAPFVRTGNPILIMDIRTAELTKYAANAMLATRISFMNEMANLCERIGADVHALRKGVGSDPRIGASFLFPGTGYGGSCFPKDVKAAMRTAESVDYELAILNAVDQVNERQKEILFDKANRFFGSNLKGKSIAVWGLAFKPKTDDIREAPSLVVIDKLLRAGAKVRVYDPVAMKNVSEIFGRKVSYGRKSYSVLKGADALLVITEWNEFREPDYERMLKLMRSPVIFDGRNIYNGKKLKDMGFRYFGIGC